MNISPVTVVEQDDRLVHLLKMRMIGRLLHSRQVEYLAAIVQPGLNPFTGGRGGRARAFHTIQIGCCGQQQLCPMRQVLLHMGAIAPHEPREVHKFVVNSQFLPFPGQHFPQRDLWAFLQIVRVRLNASPEQLIRRAPVTRMRSTVVRSPFLG
jgi:hypothetical protein